MTQFNDRVRPITQTSMTFQDKKWVIQGGNKRCLDCDPEKKTLFVNPCDESNENMKWTFSDIDVEALKNFDKLGPS